jgi:hypothetical protein
VSTSVPADGVVGGVVGGVAGGVVGGAVGGAVEAGAAGARLLPPPQAASIAGKARPSTNDGFRYMTGRLHHIWAGVQPSGFPDAGLPDMRLESRLQIAEAAL